ncbi:MAG: golvesin C-terminal-like domain-containing protein, partial [Planctomycetota bacterium]
MEIIYCAECGNMIPPGGVDEGKRYLKDGEPICPKCYKKLPEGEHSGKTMVVSESIVEQLASAEPLEPDYGPKPKTSKLLIPAVRRRRPGSGGHPVVGEEAAGSSRGLVWGAVALVVVLGLAAVVAVGRRGGGSGERPAVPGPSEGPGPVTPPVDPPADPPVDPQPQPDDGKQRAAFEAAEKFREENPKDYAGAIDLFEKVRKAASGTEWARRAAEAVMKVEEARGTEVKEVLDGLADQASKREEAGDYDGALKVYSSDPEERLASVLKPRFETAVAGVKARAEEKIGELTAPAEKLSAQNKPEEALGALKAADGLKYAAGTKKIAELRAKYEKQKVDLAAARQREREAKARDLLASVLGRFERLVMKGDCGKAARKLKGEQAKVDADSAKLIGNELAAVEKLAAALTAARNARNLHLEKLRGREVELRLASGETPKGTVVKVRRGSFDLEIVKKVGTGKITAKRRVPFDELAPGQLREFLPADEPAGAEERLVAAVKLMSPEWGAPDPENLKKAGEMLAGAGDHPLRGRWEKQLAVLLHGEKEAAAQQAWKDGVEKRLREKYTPGEARALLAALAAFTAAHGATKFAEGKAGEIAKLRQEGESACAPPPPAKVEIIIDDASPGGARKGVWQASKTPGAYNGSAVYSTQKGSFRWTPDLPVAGTYRVYAWWTAYRNRTEEATYTIVHSGKSSPVTVNQRKDGGKWNLLGEFPFGAGRGGYVELSGKQGQILADAVRFVKVTPGPLSSAEIVVDNASPGATRKGVWEKSGTTTAYDGFALYAKSSTGASFRWTPDLPVAGTYRVYAWWTAHKNRTK